MGQLFERVNRVVRSEINASKGDCEENPLNEGTALVAGGAVAGTSIGKVGILAGGAGYSVGAVPLAALGALTGAALYEALRSTLEKDSSSANAVVIGASAGAATSAAIGGVGVAAGGSAIGVGIVSMAAGGAVVALGLVGINRLLQQGIDPEKLLDRAIEQMEAAFHKANRASANVLTTQKLIQRQYDQTRVEVDKWERKAQLALQKGREDLAREALIRKNMHTKSLNSLKAQLEQEPDSIKQLNQNLARLKAKIVEAKALRTRLKAQIATAKAEGQLQSTVGSLGTSSAMSAFERMEERVMQMEARSQTAAELAGADLESQFAQLASGGDVDAELEALKTQLLGGSSPRQAQIPSSAPKDSVDAELEALKQQLDQL